MAERNNINITWIEKTKEISYVPAKAAALSKVISGVLSSSKSI